MLFGWWFNPWELWEYWLVHTCSSYGTANPFSSLGTFSSSFIGDLVLPPMDYCGHPLLYLPGTGRAPQETAISGSCLKALVAIVSGLGGCLIVLLLKSLTKETLVLCADNLPLCFPSQKLPSSLQPGNQDTETAGFCAAFSYSSQGLPPPPLGLEWPYP